MKKLLNDSGDLGRHTTELGHKPTLVSALWPSSLQACDHLEQVNTEGKGLGDLVMCHGVQLLEGIVCVYPLFYPTSQNMTRLPSSLYCGGNKSLE